LFEAADRKAEELEAQRTEAFESTEVQEQRVKEVVPGFYGIKEQLANGDITKQAAANEIFAEFTAYTGFTYVTYPTANKTLKTGLFKGTCQDFAQALADLFTEVGIEGAKRKTLDAHDFITRPATNFIDKSCPGNIKTEHGGYPAINRFFFAEHEITTSEVGEFDPTAGVIGDTAVDNNLVGFTPVTQTERDLYGLAKNETGFIKGVVFLKELAELAPTGGPGCEMKQVTLQV
jgi:hypothetical protein